MLMIKTETSATILLKRLIKDVLAKYMTFSMFIYFYNQDKSIAYWLIYQQHLEKGVTECLGLFSLAFENSIQ